MRAIREKVGSAVLKLNYIGRLAVFFIMLITTVDVILRKVSNYSILGSYELTELAMVVMVFFGIASYQVKNGHIRVDFIINNLPEHARLYIEAIALLAEAAMVCALTWAGVKSVTQILSRGTSTGILHIVQWPFYLIMTIGLALFLVMLTFDMIIKFDDAIHYTGKSNAS